jgi:hypothetical protein
MRTVPLARVGWEALEAWILLVGPDTIHAQTSRQC